MSTANEFTPGSCDRSVTKMHHATNSPNRKLISTFGKDPD